jgi:hypothetical protein
MLFGLFDRQIEPPTKPLQSTLGPLAPPTPETVKTVGMMLKYVCELEQKGKKELAKKQWKAIADECNFYAER